MSVTVINVRLRSRNGVGVLPNWTEFEAEIPGDGPVVVDPPAPPTGDTPYYKTRAFIATQLLAEVYSKYGVTPAGRGSGPLDSEYYTDVIIETGGWVNPTERGENNIGYWRDKISADLEAHGYRRQR